MTTSARDGGCPDWCDGQHGADDDRAVFHGRLVGRRRAATAVLSWAVPRDPRQAGSGPVIVLGADQGERPVELDAGAAIRLLAALQAGADDRTWLARVLCSALRLLGQPPALPLTQTGRPPRRPQQHTPESRSMTTDNDHHPGRDRATRSSGQALRKGIRVVGVHRSRLGAALGSRYDSGESIRALAASTGRSYGFVHRLLRESGVQLRRRGGVTHTQAAGRRASRAGGPPRATRM